MSLPVPAAPLAVDRRPSPVPPAVEAVRRSVEIEDHGDTTRVITTLTTPLGEPPARLWPLLTSAPELLQWYGPVGGQLRPGGTFHTTGGAHGHILEADAPHRLRLTWEYGSNVDDLEIRLDPEDDGTTELRLVHDARIDTEVFTRFGPGATALGWDIALLGLASHTDGWHELCLEVPAPSPTWLTGPDGARHVRAWAIRWAAAAIAAGTEESQARAQESATMQAYGAAPEAVPAPA